MAMYIAISVIGLMTLLLTVVVTQAVNLSHASVRSRDSKRALAAAQAGLNTALHQMNTSPLTGSTCIASVAGITIGGQTCTSQSDPGSLGNGATYSYSVTPVLSLLSSPQCAGPFAVGAELASLLNLATSVIGVSSPDLERCVTAVGEVNGVRRKASLRLSSTLLAFNSILADDLGDPGADVTLTGATLAGPTIPEIGTNGKGKVALDATTWAGRLSVPAPATAAAHITPSNGGSYAAVPTLRSTPRTLVPPVAPASYNNGNATCKISILIVGLVDCGTVGGSGSNPVSGRSFNLANTLQTVTLASGSYNFCDFKLSAGTIVGPAVTQAPAKIFVEDPNSDPACTSSQGNLDISGGTFNALTLGVTPANVQFYVRGHTDGEGSVPGATPTVQVRNTGTIFKGLIYAPHSKVTVSNGAAFTGAVSAWKATVSGATTAFTGIGGSSLLGLSNLNLDQGLLPPLYKRASFKECAPTSTPSPCN